MKYCLYFNFIFLMMSSALRANETIKFTAAEIDNIGIEVGKVKLAGQSLTSGLPARITIPNKSQWVISAPQGGLLEMMLVAEGDNVAKGQVLAQINSPQLLARQHDYLLALSRLTTSRQEMLRDKGLFEEGIIAERRYRRSLSAYQQDNTKVSMYKKILELAGMDNNAITKLERTRALNGHLTVRATEGGVVMTVFSMAGQRLKAADPIYKIAQLSSLWLEVHVPMELAHQLEVGGGILVCQKAIEGQIIAIGREVHAADQGVLVRAHINKETKQLTPGEFVQACFVQHKEQLQFKLPRSAIVHHEGNTAVFLKTEDGFVSQVINVINDNGKDAVVTGNLSAQQQIVIKGTAAVKAAWLAISEK